MEFGEFDQRTVWTFIFVIAAAFAYRYMPRWRAGVPFVAPEGLKKRLDAGEDVVILDVRTPGEYHGRGGHLPGAVSLPAGDLAARLRHDEAALEPLKQHPVFVHCTGELRAAKAARILTKAGFSDISVLKGGIQAWKRRRFPIEQE